MNIFFDLDGTLIDSRQRLYRLFQHLAPQSNFSFDQYWFLKRSQMNHASILKQFFDFNDSEINSFENKWMKLIEDEQYLKFDKPFEGVSDYLKSLKSKGFSLYLVTARQLKRRTLSQIDNFGWSELFQNILVTEQKVTKTSLIKPYLEFGNENWIIGDTGKDIEAGNILMINTIGVLSGFLSEHCLKKYSPNRIVNSVLDFNPLVQS